MPPSPVVVLVPTAEAPRPSASLEARPWILPSVECDIVDMEMIEAAGRSIHPEVVDPGLAIETAAAQHVGQTLAIVGCHRFFDAVGAEAFDLAAHEDRCFIDGVA